MREGQGQTKEARRAKKTEERRGKYRKHRNNGRVLSGDLAVHQAPFAPHIKYPLISKNRNPLHLHLSLFFRSHLFDWPLAAFDNFSFLHHPKIDESKSTAPPPPPPPLSSSSSTFLMVRFIQLSASLMTTGAFSSMNIPKLRSWCSLISASLAPHERTISSTHAGAFTLRRQNHSLIPT